jgi:uncharacterized protein with PIN domain
MGITKTKTKFEVRTYCDNNECSFTEMNKIISAVSKKAARETASSMNQNENKKRCPDCNNILIHFVKSI